MYLQVTDIGTIEVQLKVYILIILNYKEIIVMKQIKIINAYRTTEELVSNPDIDENMHWQIYKVRKAIRSNVDFYNERVSMLNNKYANVTDENGIIKGEDFIHYQNELEEINNLDVEVEPFDVPVLPLVKGINFKQIEALEDFVNFEPTE